MFDLAHARKLIADHATVYRAYCWSPNRAVPLNRQLTDALQAACEEIERLQGHVARMTDGKTESVVNMNVEQPQ